MNIYRSSLSFIPLTMAYTTIQLRFEFELKSLSPTSKKRNYYDRAHRSWIIVTKVSYLSYSEGITLPRAKT